VYQRCQKELLFLESLAFNAMILHDLWIMSQLNIVLPQS
jgi:hypothetical protein